MAGGSSWESYLHDVWSIEPSEAEAEIENDNDPMPDQDNDENDEDNDSDVSDGDGDGDDEDEDENADADVEADNELSLWSFVNFQRGSSHGEIVDKTDAITVGGSLNVMTTGPVPPSPMMLARSPATLGMSVESLFTEDFSVETGLPLGSAVEFSFYPSFDEYQHDMRPDANSNAFGHGRRPSIVVNGGFMPLSPNLNPASESVIPPEPVDLAATSTTAETEVSSEATATSASSPLDTPATVLLASVTQAFIEQPRTVQPSAMVESPTPVRRKLRMEEELCAAIARDLPADKAPAVQRLLGLVDDTGDDDGLYDDDEMELLMRSSSRLHERLLGLPQSRLLELHDLVLGVTLTSRPGTPSRNPVPLRTATQTPPRRQRAGKSRRKSTGWSKKRRAASSGPQSEARGAASDEDFGISTTSKREGLSASTAAAIHLFATATIASADPSDIDDDGDEEEDEDEIDVVGV